MDLSKKTDNFQLKISKKIFARIIRASLPKDSKSVFVSNLSGKIGDENFFEIDEKKNELVIFLLFAVGTPMKETSKKIANNILRDYKNFFGEEVETLNNKLKIIINVKGLKSGNVLKKTNLKFED